MSHFKDHDENEDMPYDYGYYLDEFFDQRLDLNNSYYLEAESSFVISHNKIYNYIYRMRLDKDDFKRI